MDIFYGIGMAVFTALTLLNLQVCHQLRGVL